MDRVESSTTTWTFVEINWRKYLCRTTRCCFGSHGGYLFFGQGFSSFFPRVGTLVMSVLQWKQVSSGNLLRPTDSDQQIYIRLKTVDVNKFTLVSKNYRQCWGRRRLSIVLSSCEFSDYHCTNIVSGKRKIRPKIATKEPQRGSSWLARWTAEKWRNGGARENGQLSCFQMALKPSVRVRAPVNEKSTNYINIWNLIMKRVRWFYKKIVNIRSWHTLKPAVHFIELSPRLIDSF